MAIFDAIMAIIGAVGGVSIWKLATAKDQVKKEHVEAEDMEIEAMKKVIAELREQIDRLNEEVAKLKAINEENDSRRYFAENLLCVHKGCAMRKPELGAGRKWWEANSTDGDLECDAKSTNDLIVEYNIKGE